MTAPFRYYTRVRYQDCDAQHVVFNARYGDYVDLAITEFLRASFPERDPFDGSLEIQVVRQLIEWKAPGRTDAEGDPGGGGSGLRAPEDRRRRAAPIFRYF